ncbi:MAG: metallophosphoesterase, partial [Bdellovibrionales bacterium]|nr:metallophosphoesterase [Bdellovibrionales bacterium]
DSIRTAGIFQVIMAGDNIYDTSQSYGQVWGPWLDTGFQFPVVAIGNHTRGYSEEVTFFRTPGEFYSWTSAGARFLVLNSDREDSADSQARWLSEQLKSAQEKIIFLVYHHPPVTLTARHSWTEKRRFHEATLPVILANRKKISAILVGHDHITSLTEFGEIPVVVSGAVHESIPTSPVNSLQRGYPVSTRWLFRDGFYWTRMDVDGSTGSVGLSFVRSNPDEVSCTARIQPRPMVLSENCYQSGLTGP